MNYKTVRFSMTGWVLICLLGATTITDAVRDPGSKPTWLTYASVVIGVLGAGCIYQSRRFVGIQKDFQRILGFIPMHSPRSAQLWQIQTEMIEAHLLGLKKLYASALAEYSRRTVTYSTATDLAWLEELRPGRLVLIELAEEINSGIQAATAFSYQLSAQSLSSVDPPQHPITKISR